MTRARLLGLAYLAAGLGLAAWVVNLWRALNEQSLAHHLPVVKGVVGGLLVTILLATLLLDVSVDHDGGLAASPSVAIRVLAPGVIVSGLATEWFLLLPGAATQPADAVFAFVVAVATGIVVLAYRGSLRAGPRRVLLLVVIILVAVSTVVMVLQSDATVLGVRQRVVWVGLDIAELVALVLTGVRLVRSQSARVPATCAACLFLLDVAINVGVASGGALGAAVVMGCLEIPACVLSAVVAYRSARSERDGPPEKGLSLPRSRRDSSL